MLEACDGVTTEFDPFRKEDCLKLVDCVRSTMSAQRTPDGCVSPLGIKVINAILDCLEAKLGERRGPVAVP